MAGIMHLSPVHKTIYAIATAGGDETWVGDVQSPSGAWTTTALTDTERVIVSYLGDGDPGLAEAVHKYWLIIEDSQGFLHFESFEWATHGLRDRERELEDAYNKWAGEDGDEDDDEGPLPCEEGDYIHLPTDFASAIKLYGDVLPANVTDLDDVEIGEIHAGNPVRYYVRMTLIRRHGVPKRAATYPYATREDSIESITVYLQRRLVSGKFDSQVIVGYANPDRDAKLNDAPVASPSRIEPRFSQAGLASVEGAK